MTSEKDRPRTDAPPLASTGGSLDQVNEGFHAVYGEARHAAKQDGPVFVVVADQLVVFRDGKRTAYSFSPRAFHVIKSVAHAPVALYALFERPEPPDVTELNEARARIASAQASAAKDAQELSPGARRELGEVLEACAVLLNQTLAEPPSRERLAQFAGTTGPWLLSLAQEATRLQLDALHLHTEQALQELSASERVALQVVVAGDHQARVRSLAMQYFQKRFEQRSDAEQRVSYAEGVDNEQGALELVGTQRLDRSLARAFFGEEKRLQRDILGDAVTEQLRTFRLAPIG